MPGQWIAIGKVMRAVGLDGRCGIQTFGNGFASLVPPCRIRVGRDEASGRDAVVAEIREHGGAPVCLFEGVHDRTTAELLRGLFLFVERESLPALAENEFYQDDLREMQVFGDVSGALIGTVHDVLSMPSMDTIEVLLKKGGIVMLPFTAQAIERVDPVMRRITVRESFVEELLE